LADYLAKSKGWDAQRLRKIFDAWGKPKNLGKEYENEKDNFDLNKYPIKQAFDFAWKNLAKSIYNKYIDAPLGECRDYLKDNFNLTEDNEKLQLYVHLLEMTQSLAVIDYQNPDDATRHDLKNKIKSVVSTLRELRRSVRNLQIIETRVN